VNRFTRWVVAPLIFAVAVVGLGATSASAAVTGTTTAPVLSIPNGSDFTWSCTINPDGTTQYVSGRWWLDPLNGTVATNEVDPNLPVENGRNVISGTDPVTLYYSSNGAENSPYRGRCLTFATSTTQTYTWRTPEYWSLTTSYDGDAPVAALEASPNPVDEDTVTTLSASGTTDSDNDIVSYDFDFGDGTTSTGHAWHFVEHVYTEPGTYTGSVTVHDAKGLTDTETTQVTVTDVQEPVPPDAQLTANLTTVVEGGEVIADASGSSDLNPGDTLTCTFDFGDGTTVGPQVCATASHTYADEGTYTITVTVSDGTDSDTAQVAVVVKTSTLFGSNVDGSTRVPCSTPGVGTCRASDSTRPETFEEALARQDAAYSPEAVRLFFTGLPSTSCTGNVRNALARERPATMSWKADPASVIAGTHDATLNSWLGCFTHPTRVGYYHEPEDNFPAGTASVNYVLASRHFLTLVENHPNRPNLIRTQTFADYNFVPAANRNWLDWYAGDAYVDEIGWDLYNFQEEDADPNNNETMAQHQAKRPSYAVTVARGKGYRIDELGYDDPATRPGFLGDVIEWAQEKDAKIVHYFDSIGGLGDHRLLDTSSQEVWAAGVAS
jgi:PKD repeat protein